MRDYSDDMEDREMENFKTLQKKKDRITSSDGISSRNRIQQLMESANGVPPIRARYRNTRKNEAKNNDSEHGKNKQGICQKNELELYSFTRLFNSKQHLIITFFFL